MAGKARANSKRQIAIGVFNTEVSKLVTKKIDIATHLGDSATHKEFRGGILKTIIAECLKLEIAEPSVGCLGALYNDARHTAIQAGTCVPFGRYGKGSNGASKESQAKKAAEAAEALAGAKANPDNKWALQNKETKEIVGYFISSTVAKKHKTEETTMKKREDAEKALVKAQAEAVKAAEEEAKLAAEEEAKLAEEAAKAEAETPAEENKEEAAAEA